MMSFASVDRIEGNIVVLEVELINFWESNSKDFNNKATEMMDVSLEIFNLIRATPNEGEIYVVVHDNDSISEVIYRDKVEEEERIKILESIKGDT